MHSDKIIVLDDGKVVGIGKHDELLDNCTVYSEIYNSQFRKESV
jgi:ABC-type multidrug transport system fused ATPase/permease subunit